MKYYIVEGKTNGEFNASSKAREDVEKILNNNKFNRLYINSKNGTEKKMIMKWRQVLIYRRNIKAWIRSLQKLKKNDIVCIQYPLLNTTFGLKKTLKRYKKNGIVFVAIIHDLDSLRYTPENQGRFLYNRVCYDDKYVLREMNYIIAHNSAMKKELIKLGNDGNKIIELKLFDYLVSSINERVNRGKTDPIIIAGNLSLSKSKYLSDLKNIDMKFNLYGAGYDNSISSKNINYCGSFKPEELIENMEGSYGLVWDGISIETCTGGFGEYLKYNNPHKASLYLTAGIPLIVWNKSALAEFVKKNKLGITVNNLNEIKSEIEKITKTEYIEILNNVWKISKKLQCGYFLSTAVNKIIKE